MYCRGNYDIIFLECTVFIFSILQILLPDTHNTLLTKIFDIMHALELTVHRCDTIYLVNQRNRRWNFDFNACIISIIISQSDLQTVKPAGAIIIFFFHALFFFSQGINSLPVISNLPLSTPVTIQENSALSTSVFQVAVTDVDVGQTHTYQLYCSPSIGSTLFFVNSSSQ